MVCSKNAPCSPFMVYPGMILLKRSSHNNTKYIYILLRIRIHAYNTASVIRVQHESCNTDRSLRSNPCEYKTHTMNRPSFSNLLRAWLQLLLLSAFCIVYGQDSTSPNVFIEYVSEVIKSPADIVFFDGIRNQSIAQVITI